MTATERPGRAPGRPRARRGTTLIEVTVFMAVGIVVLGGAWSFFSSSIRKGKATDVKVESVQANLLLARRLEKDLHRLYEDTNHLMKTNKVAGSRFTFEFWRTVETPPGAAWDRLQVEKVTYRFDSTRKRVYRTVGASPEVPLFGHFERFNVRFINYQRPQVGQPLPPTPAVVVSMVSTPKLELRKPLEEREEPARTTLFLTAHREVVASRATYPEWNPLPLSPAGPPP